MQISNGKKIAWNVKSCLNKKNITSLPSELAQRVVKIKKTQKILSDLIISKDKKFWFEMALVWDKRSLDIKSI